MRLFLPMTGGRVKSGGSTLGISTPRPLSIKSSSGRRNSSKPTRWVSLCVSLRPLDLFLPLPRFVFSPDTRVFFCPHFFTLSNVLFSSPFVSVRGPAPLSSSLLFCFLSFSFFYSRLSAPAFLSRCEASPRFRLNRFCRLDVPPPSR